MRKNIGRVLGFSFLFYVVFYIGADMPPVIKLFYGDQVGHLYDVRKYLFPVYWGILCLCIVILSCTLYIVHNIKQQAKNMEALLAQKTATEVEREKAAEEMDETPEN